uniref:Ig-like domain-containing protein n=1 Tax=Gouania willdenowi TaxID=441366 RepID=A0A8C5GLV8_GOUWI
MSTSCSRLLLFQVLVLVLVPGVQSYEAPEDQQEDMFSTRACPAFLTFSNAAFLSGVTAELPCLCKPQQSVVWFFRKHQSGAEDTRALTDHHGNRLMDSSHVSHSSDLRSRFSIRLFSLLIFRIRTHDSGLYICGSAHNDYFYGYDVDVQEAKAVSLVTSFSHASLQTFTSYGPWTVCDRCGPPGEQVRIGLCYVHSRLLHVRYRRANQTVASCGSGAVPKALSRLIQSTDGARLEVRPCHVTCPTQAPPPSVSSLSPSEPMRVYYLSHPSGGVVTLDCPGSRPNMAVGWDHGSRPIYRFEGPTGAANRRLMIDAGHHLVFQSAHVHDTGSYFCWLQGRRVAELRLLVYPSLGLGQSETLPHSELMEAVITMVTWYSIMSAVFILLMFCRFLLRYHRDAAGM